METSVVVLSVVVLLFAVASAVLGFIAETTKLTPDDINYSGGVCVYPAKPAYVLGICAAALLAAAQIIASVAGCGCCHKPPQGGGASGPKRKKAIISAVLSWVAAVLAVAGYVQGVVWNAATTRDAVTVGWLIECHYLKGAVFRRAALLGLAAAVLGICSYAMRRAPPAASGAEPNKPDGQQAAAGGEAQNPQFPPPQVQAHAPVV